MRGETQPLGLSAPPNLPQGRYCSTRGERRLSSLIRATSDQKQAHYLHRPLLCWHSLRKLKQPNQTKETSQTVSEFLVMTASTLGDNSTDVFVETHSQCTNGHMMVAVELHTPRLDKSHTIMPSPHRGVAEIERWLLTHAPANSLIVKRSVQTSRAYVL